MEHDVGAVGTTVRLRPVTLADAALILELRTDEDLGRHLHATPPSLAAQEEWIARYLTRPDDWYFVVESSDGTPEGTLGIYDVTADRGAAEWGRWVLRRGSMAAVESAALVYEVGFGQLGFDLIWCRTRAANAKVVSFHASFGLELIGTEPDPLDGQPMTRQQLTRTRWLELGPDIARRVAMAARFAGR